MLPMLRYKSFEPDLDEPGLSTVRENVLAYQWVFFTPTVRLTGPADAVLKGDEGNVKAGTATALAVLDQRVVSCIMKLSTTAKANRTLAARNYPRTSISAATWHAPPVLYKSYWHRVSGITEVDVFPQRTRYIITEGDVRCEGCACFSPLSLLSALVTNGVADTHYAQRSHLRQCLDSNLRHHRRLLGWRYSTSSASNHTAPPDPRSIAGGPRSGRRQSLTVRRLSM